MAMIEHVLSAFGVMNRLIAAFPCSYVFNDLKIKGSPDRYIAIENNHSRFSGQRRQRGRTGLRIDSGSVANVCNLTQEFEIDSIAS